MDSENTEDNLSIDNLLSSNSLIFLQELIIEIIAQIILENDIINNKNYINDIKNSRISAHLLHNGNIEEAVVTAVAIGLFEAVKQNGHQVNMTAKDIKKYLHFKKDDRLGQLVFVKIIKFMPESIIYVDELSDTDRGNNGFGSSGK